MTYSLQLEPSNLVHLATVPLYSRSDPMYQTLFPLTPDREGLRCLIIIFTGLPANEVPLGVS